MKTVSVVIEAKKGEKQTGRFLIDKAIPYPDIERGRWRNSGGIFREYQEDIPRGIGNKYYCYLLAEGVTVKDGESYSRTSFAGYEDSPGAFTVRGKTLGEMTIELTPGDEYANIKVRGFDNPTTSERDLIKDQIIPQLQKFINENAEELKQQAFKKIAENLKGRISGARQELDELEKQAETAIKNLKI